MDKVIVTGCAGLLGNHLTRYLLDNGHDVFGIDNLSGGYSEYLDDRLRKNMQFANIDLVSVDHVKNVFNHFQPDYVYHFAAYAALGLSPFIRNFNYSNNILASVNVINACINHDVRKIIFASSMDVYGNQTPPFTEDMTPRPEDPYGIAKYAIELDLANAYVQFGLKYSIVRPHNIVGIYQNIWDKYRNVIGIWIRRILDNEPILIYGDGEQTRAFSDVKYYMKPFEQLMTECDNETLNMGADDESSLNHVANDLKQIAKGFGYDVQIEYVEARHEVKNAFSDHTKAKTLLNFKDNTDLYELIKNMFVWAKEQPRQEVKQFEYEIEKNMYSYWKKD